MKTNEIGKSAKEALAYVKAIPPAQGKTMMNVPFKKRDLVRFGFIGMGGRGLSQLNEVLAVKGSRSTAVSDPAEEQMLKARESVEKAGQPAPALEKDWQSLCERSDVDLVYICSPWDMHVPQAVRAMECGKHVAIEVPAATTLADCWRLVDVSERTRRHCVLLENCCYGKPELTVLNLVRKGRLGTITHGEAAYIHDLRSILLAPHGEGVWRRKPHQTRNGNLYPTHGLGPVAWYMGIHHGDRFARLVSMSSPSAALAEYRDATLSAGDPKRREKYRCGDMNTSLIQTANGRTIMLQHDTVTPRPYSRLNLVQGSKGTFSDYPPRIFFDGQKTHDWASYETIEDKYEHPLWKKQGAQALKLGGHGGMDYIMNYRLVQTFRQGLPPDLNVYDAAAWSAPGPLSNISVAWDSLSLPFPDFTRGKWRQTGSVPLA
ncbi:MAG: Gfo/Idh/MocA family oxidoreductase [Kiritimatiellaeota bacterium]|nr:Gfo/Idh/MocA family oxidoreductase [Kiritimatiellota bacterium]